MIAVTSPGFVLFAALLAGLWYACPPLRRWQLLLGANLLFYAVLCPAALPVLPGSSFLVWWCGRRTAKKPVFLAGLAAALLPLALLKYLPAALGWQGTLANALGIGYFTLQLVSYLCDVRRGRILPEEKYARLLCYASFFLSITQGPFNRYDALMPQLDRPTVWDTDRVWRGVQRSAWGYFKKLAVADRAAVVVDTVFANPAAFDRTQLLLGGVLFTVQLYADFSGYTDIVLGVGEVLGLHLPEKLPPAVLCRLGQGHLGAVAHQPVAVAAGLYLYSAGRQPVQQGTQGRKPDYNLPRQRPVARRGVDLPRLGRPARPVPGGGKPPAAPPPG